jgi:uncharacterized membrane protein
VTATPRPPADPRVSVRARANVSASPTPALGRRRTVGWNGTIGSMAAAVGTAAMIATPLAPTGGVRRRVLSTVVVTALATTTASRAGARWGGARATGTLVGIATATAAVERLGTRSGLPFGRYAYTGVLRPTVGGVPAVVPLAWFAMAVPAREAAAAALGARDRRGPRVVLGALALTAWDLFLDPQMVQEGYWRWMRRGTYRGIPLSNFAGWFVTGLGVMTLLELLLPPDRPPDAALVGEYAFMGAMETVGFAAFFRDRLVALAGGASMLPIAALAVRRVWAERR